LRFLIAAKLCAQDKVEGGCEEPRIARYVYEKRALEKAVPCVCLFAGEVELRREDRAARRLNADVNVAGAALINARDDGCDAVGAVCVREKMTAIAKALQVVSAPGVRVPDVDESACDWLAARGQDAAR
jgi:hypothetical protein